jgi:formylglycine-generating enzyme required for sulfatase activity
MPDTQSLNPFLSAICLAAIANADASGDRPAVRLDASLADAAWAQWSKLSDEGRKTAEIQAAARLSGESLESLARGLVAETAGTTPAQLVQALRAFIRCVPPVLRSFFRRPADPEGTTVPAGWRLGGSADLLALLPCRTAWFEPGQKPQAVGDGDWELIDLLGLEIDEETWKAQKQGRPGQPMVCLQFLHDPRVKERLRKTGSGDWATVRELTAQPGWVRLRDVHAQADPPCLEWANASAGSFRGQMREWQANGASAPWREVCQWMQEVAVTLGHAHRQRPPLVHRGLNTARILATGAGARMDCRLAGMGLSLICTFDARLTSPQQQRGDAVDARDDVFSLGIILYQMLTRDPGAGRPGGSQWKRRLAGDAVPAGLVDVLESCFEDDPRHRPADGTELAARIEATLREKAAPAAASPAVDLSSLMPAAAPTPTAAPESAAVAGRDALTRTRSRRADVKQLFQSLEETVQERPKLFTNSLDMKMVLLPPGTFWMGSPPAEAGRRDNEGPRHEVNLANHFYLAVHTVTQLQYQKVMKANPSHFDPIHGGGPAHPVENVSWDDAVEFCRRLSALPAEREAGRSYRLPTEAEWEYACRAGTATPFAFGESLSVTAANYDGNFPYGGGEVERGDWAEKTLPPGGFPANHFGLCDMHGNVWEWCSDWLSSEYYAHSPKRNPAGPAAGRFRVLRGGSWRSHAVTCRSAYRNGLSPRSRDRMTGFRVALDAQ